jgi:hypothetical protein
MYGWEMAVVFAQLMFCCGLHVCKTFFHSEIGCQQFALVWIALPMVLRWDERRKLSPFEAYRILQLQWHKAECGQPSSDPALTSHMPSPPAGVMPCQIRSPDGPLFPIRGWINTYL